jgi:hypothetical protein
VSHFDELASEPPNIEPIQFNGKVTATLFAKPEPAPVPWPFAPTLIQPR